MLLTVRVDSSGAFVVVPIEDPPTHPCSFCTHATSAEPDIKTTWRVCAADLCQRAAIAQKERMYAGLFDSPETRRSALQWVERQ